jgi:small subunit ribosomal protein S16
MLTIRLRRMGNRNRPFYRVVVSDSRKTPTASAVEEVGYYNPTSDPPQVSIDAERVQHWMGVGAQPSRTVLKLLRTQEGGAS